MKIEGATAIVTGGASGLGAATVAELAKQGAQVVAFDLKGDAPAGAMICHGDVTNEADVNAALDFAREQTGSEVRICINCAGIGWAQRTVTRNGPHDYEAFKTVVNVNLVGTFNVMRLAAARMAGNEPVDGDRGVIVNTASIAAFDGQIGQISYSASKGGVVGMTLPAARDLASLQIRVCTIAPGTFDTPLLGSLPQDVRDALGAAIPHPSRLGEPSEFGSLAAYIVQNPVLNGETIRLDGALRMPPK